jgi:protein kinase A
LERPNIIRQPLTSIEKENKEAQFFLALLLMNPNFKFGSTNESVAPQEDTTNWKLTDFEFLETLGTGTFGRVRLCKQKNSSIYYAIKVLKKADIIRLKQVEHILSEKSVLSSVNHPFIVRLYKTFQDDMHLYMILEYVCGGELFSHLRKVGKFPNDVC